MSKRVNLSVTDELYEWLQKKAEVYGSPIATTTVMLLSQYKYMESAQTVSQGIVSFMDKLSGAERALFLLGEKGISDMVEDSAFNNIPAEQRDFILSQLEQRKKEADKADNNKKK